MTHPINDEFALLVLAQFDNKVGLSLFELNMFELDFNLNRIYVWGNDPTWYSTKPINFAHVVCEASIMT